MQMFETNLRWGRAHGEDRFYTTVKPRRNNRRGHQRGPRRSQNGVASSAARESPSPPPVSKEDDRVGLGKPASKPLAASASPSPSSTEVAQPCNLDRFLESTTPSVPAQYLSKVQNVSSFFPVVFSRLELLLTVAWISDNDEGSEDLRCGV